MLKCTLNTKFHRRRVILDSGASTNLFSAGWAQESDKAPALIDGLHETKLSGPAATAVLNIDGSLVHVAGHLTPDLPDNCVALFGRPAIRHLTKTHGPNVDFHTSQKSDSCPDLMFRGKSRKRVREVVLRPPSCSVRRTPKMKDQRKTWFMNECFDDTLQCKPLPSCHFGKKAKISNVDRFIEAQIKANKKIEKQWQELTSTHMSEPEMRKLDDFKGRCTPIGKGSTRNQNQTRTPLRPKGKARGAFIMTKNPNPGKGRKFWCHKNKCEIVLKGNH